MATTLPLAVRVAAGLIAAGIERIRSLPEELPGLSVTVAGQAARISLRVQQEIAALAEAGDQIIGSFTHRAEEQPAWARFDEDDEGGAAGDAAVGDAAASDIYDASTGRIPGDSGSVGRKPVQPAAMPGYDELRIAQVRARMRALDAAGIEQLLAHERAGQARPAFLTMLENRLTTLAHAGDDPGGAGA